ncbi:hypothetical protein DFJ74DRAFT_636039 [Hyaloraphidium curvatum]|nr:hypothetical protein DFJ74DRAFT_636039 [Hyaloraphidium curvatum]
MESPVIIGVAQVRNKSRRLEDAREPLALAAEAVELAFADSGGDPAALRAAVDDVTCMMTTSWFYSNPAEHLSGRLGVKPKTVVTADIGGNTPMRYLDEAARRVARGESHVAVVAGGEAWYSLNAWAAQNGTAPAGWTAPARTALGSSRERKYSMASDLCERHGLDKPVQIYPMFELALRAAQGKTQKEADRESAEIYAELSKIAQTNEGAWFYGDGAKTADEISTISPSNRMICYPYPLLMNAILPCNQSFAVVIASASAAKRLGIPASKMVHVLGGAGASDSTDILARSSYSRSFAMEASFEAAVAAAGLSGTKDIDLIDLYSCFPIMVKISARHLGIDPRGTDRPLSLCGGNTFFGGINYSGHGAVAVVRALREGRGKVGLVHGNGEFLTKHHVVLFSTETPRRPYPSSNPIPYQYPPPTAPPPLLESVPRAPTRATIETYTVEYSRSGAPERGWVIGRLDGKRFLACVDGKDAGTVGVLTGGEVEPIGMEGWAWNDGGKDGGRNWFRLGEKPKL